MPCIFHVVTEAIAEDVALLDRFARLLRAALFRLPTEVEGVGGVTREQWGTLMDIGRGCAGAVSMGELAAGRGMSLNSASALVDRLVSAGLVERRHDEEDRRVVRVVLSAQGKELKEAIAAARSAEHERILGELSGAEVETLWEALPALAKLAGVCGRRP